MAEQQQTLFSGSVFQLAEQSSGKKCKALVIKLFQKQAIAGKRKEEREMLSMALAEDRRDKEEESNGSQCNTKEKPRRGRIFEKRRALPVKKRKEKLGKINKRKLI